MLCLKVLVSVSALWCAVAQQQQAFGGFSGPLQAGRPQDAFSPGQGRPLAGFGPPQATGRALDAFGRSAGVPPGTLPLAAAPAPPPPQPPPPPRRSPAVGLRPDVSGRLADDVFGPPEPYQFQYAVSDAESGAAFRQQENSDGKGIEGQYAVQLPDGRNQIVKYSATEESGFHAEVIYEGEPVFPPAPAPGGSGGGGGGGGRVVGGQQPRSLAPRPAPAPTPTASGLALAPPGNAFASGLARPDGNLAAPRVGALPGQTAGGAFGGGSQQFDASAGGFGAGGFDATGRGGAPGPAFGNTLEAPSFGPTGGDLSIPGGSAFGSFGAPAPTVAVGGRRVNFRG
ncbi:pro-resilin-like [Schistocerca gregaria]|uniref:pro-resilin-like n=1 Tax=Schistocerca gregaria TaxID=7010 RepID=UPI00211E074A|nr:pro-resilin-like [Schistocerca gregaria]